jgi:Holliday junction resolvase RusA-like endonuclease
MKLIKRLEITPVPEPRMTRRDRFDPRPRVVRYYDFANYLREICSPDDLPENHFLVFYLAMPKSWSKKKKKEHDRTSHKQTPDIDNLFKAFIDALYYQRNDSHIWLCQAAKIWSYTPGIEIWQPEKNILREAGLIIPETPNLRNLSGIS